MFTLCMSRSHHPLDNTQHQIRIGNKQVKGGYLLRYRRGIFCPKWCEEWMVLYEDSTLVWYSDKGLRRAKGCIRIGDAPEFLAVGEWTRQVPKRPKFTSACHIGQLIAIGSRKMRNVLWFMAKSSTEINEWVTAISNTLPPPPSQSHLEDTLRMSLKLAPQQKPDMAIFRKQCLCNGEVSSTQKNTRIQQQAVENKETQKNYEVDHTVLAGICIDWGHGWGWGQNAILAHQFFMSNHEASLAAIQVPDSSIYCQAAEDYTASGMDDVDWCSFGDFTF